MDNERIDEYLEAIYRRQKQKSPVSTSSLAEDLKVSPPAVTDMLRSLEGKGFIDYRPNKGTSLTDAGSQKALGIIRRHRLWERFLTDVLGMKWDRVHDEACKLEHIASPEIEKGLENLLGNADTCPHGHAIPDKGGNIKTDSSTAPLPEFHPGQPVCIQAIDREDPGLLRKIDALGLRPGSVITIASKNDDGGITVDFGPKKLELDRETSRVFLAKAVTAAELDAITLSNLPAKQIAVIRSFTGGRGMLARCLPLGFTPGSTVKMMENHRIGPILVKIHDTEIAIGRKLADKIVVTRIGS